VSGVEIEVLVVVCASPTGCMWSERVGEAPS
jgi:hypothetical protein